MMRVLATIIIPPHLSVSGGARAGELLSAALSSHCDMTVASMMNGIGEHDLPTSGSVRRAHIQTSLPPYLPWSRVPSRFSTLFYRSNIPDLVRSGGYDLVHIHNPMPALEMERVAKACKDAGVPYVVSTHGFNEIARGEDVYDFDLTRRLAWRNLVYNPVSKVVRNADAIFMLSPADLPIVRSMGYRGTDLPLVSNGVEFAPPVEPQTTEAVCRKLGIPPERKPGQITCMFLANHTPNKGLPILLKAFSSLDIPYLLIIGGEQRDGIDYAGAMQACKPGQQIVVTGRLDGDAIAPLFQRSDLFVFPTLADTFPLVVLEAMSHGLPVVASNVGGIPHQLAKDRGMLVPPGDPESLAAAVRDLAGKPELRMQMGQSAQAHVRAEFTWKRAAEHALSGYTCVLQRRRTFHDRPAPKTRTLLGSEGSTNGFI
jgi:starch synthase